MSKKIFNVLAFATVAAVLFINVNVVLNGQPTSYLNYGSIGTAFAQASGASGSGQTNCCSFFGPTCNERISSSPIECKAATWIKRTYSENDRVVGFAVSLNGGSFQLVEGHITSNYTVSSGSYGGFWSTVVTCPTDGHCNNCTEYNPCTAVG